MSKKPNADNARTVLGASIEIEGEIESGEDLVIQGVVKGRIVSHKALTIAHSGVVEAQINTKAISVNGTLTGNIEASERVKLEKEAKVVGDVKSPKVLIVEGASFKGHIDMDLE